MIKKMYAFSGFCKYFLFYQHVIHILSKLASLYILLIFSVNIMFKNEETNFKTDSKFFHKCVCYKQIQVT